MSGEREVTNESDVAVKLRVLLAQWDTGELPLGAFEAMVHNVTHGEDEDACPRCGARKILLGSNTGDPWINGLQHDAARINWLADDTGRLEDVRGRLNNEGGTLREAIDFLKDKL